MVDDPRARLERASALKHDLGKYVAWLSTNVSAEQWQAPVPGPASEALRKDLLETRRGPRGVQAAWELWAEHAGALPDPLPEELGPVAQAVAEIEARASLLREGRWPLPADDLAALRDAQAEIREGLRAWHRSVRAEVG